METLLFLLGYALAAGICILVGRGMWRAWRKQRITRQKEQALEHVIRARELCKLPPAGWTCSREPGHDGPCAARPNDDRSAHADCPICHPLQLRPGQILDTPHMRQDYVDFVHYAQAEAERIPRSNAEARDFLGRVLTYLLTRGDVDASTYEVIDRARDRVLQEMIQARPRARRVLTDDLAIQWRLGR